MKRLPLALPLLLLLAVPVRSDDFGSANIGQLRKNGGDNVQGRPVDQQGGSQAAGDCPLASENPKKRENIIRTVIFPILSEQAGFRPEADWRPVLYIVGKNADEKKLLADWGLEKGLAFSYDPRVEINNTDDHVVMLSTNLWEKQVACTYDELGFVIGHELAHHKLHHMQKLAEMKKASFMPWWNAHKHEYDDVCTQADKTQYEMCFRKNIWPKYIEAQPAIAETARGQERDADSYGNHFMEYVNQNYSRDAAKRVLDHIKEYEARESIPATPFYDTADARAHFLDRGF